MGNSENHDNESVWDKFSNMMDTLTLWVNRICNIATIAIPVVLIAAVALLLIRFYHNGWSFFNKQTEISIDNPYYETGMRLWEELDYRKAAENLHTALEQISRSEGKGSQEAAAVSQKLGSLYLELGRYEESYELLNSAYVTFYNKLGAEDGNTVIAKCQISVYDIRTGNAERGYAALYDAFDETKYISYKLQIAQMIAQCHMLQSNYKEALQWYKQLETTYQNTGFSGPGLVSYYNDYGVLMIKLGEYEQALEYLITAVQQWQSLDVTDDLTIANIYANMAKAYALYGQYENAITYGKKGLSALQTLGLTENIQVAKAYENLAAAYGDMQRPDMEIEYLEKALDIAIATVGENHEVTAEIYNAIGTYHLNGKEVRQAIENYQKSLEIRKNLIGKNNPTTAAVYQNLAKCYNCMEQYEKSMENAREAVAICESIYGRDNIHTGQSYINMAWIDEQMGNEEDASRFVRIVLDMIDRHKSIDNEMTAQVYLTAGDIYLEQECSEEASGCYRESWQIYQGLFSDKNIYESEFNGRLEKLYGNSEASEDCEGWMERWKRGDSINEEK